MSNSRRKPSPVCKVRHQDALKVCPQDVQDDLNISDMEEPDVIEDAEEVAPGLAVLITERFRAAETGRYNHEQRWLLAYKNFRGTFNDSSTEYRNSERSKVFLKIILNPY